MSGDGRRTKRVAELVRTHLTNALRRELDDPKLALVTVTDVEVTADLSIAKVGVRLLGDDPPEVRKQLMQRLRRVTPLLRRSIAPKLALRKTPDLRFHYDTGPDAASRVEALLREVGE